VVGGVAVALALWPLTEPADVNLAAADGSALVIGADGARVLVLSAVPDADAILRTTAGATVTSVDAVIVDRDEHPRATTLEQLGKLPTPFRAGGLVRRLPPHENQRGRRPRRDQGRTGRDHAPADPTPPSAPVGPS